MDFEITEVKDDGFHIINDDTANWYLRKLRHLKDDIPVVKKQAAEIIAAIESDISGLEFRFQNEFEHYISTRIVAGKKSVKLLFGTAGYRTNPERAVFDKDQEESAMDWCRENAANLLSEKIDAGQYTKLALSHMKTSGEMLPGTDYKAPEEQFYPRPKKESQNESQEEG
jgi:5'-deoxynucleotidase YfbR-like HD superfamily hydrolase